MCHKWCFLLFIYFRSEQTLNQKFVFLLCLINDELIFESLLITLYSLNVFFDLSILWRWRQETDNRSVVCNVLGPSTQLEQFFGIFIKLSNKHTQKINQNPLSLCVISPSTGIMEYFYGFTSHRPSARAISNWLEIISSDRNQSTMCIIDIELWF